MELTFLFFTRRYIDDIFHPQFTTFDTSAFFTQIYPTVLQGPTGPINNPLILNLASQHPRTNFLDVTVIYHPATQTRGIIFQWILFDKNRYIPALATQDPFPQIDSILSPTSKYTVIRSQMHRYNRNTSLASDFVYNTVCIGTAMLDRGYKLEPLLQQVNLFDHFEKGKGEWSRVRGEIEGQLRRASQRLS